MVSLRSVTKEYQPGLPVLRSIHLDLKAGDFLFVLGGTGAGKSTLLRILALEEKMTRGALVIAGQSISDPFSEKGAVRDLRQKMGVIPQKLDLISDLSALDHLMLSQSLDGSGATSYRRAEMWLEKIGLKEKRRRECRYLSGGELQRLAIATALIRRPEIIIADEPTGAQDQEWSWALIHLFVQAAQEGATVIFATHDRELMRRNRKKCAYLKNGALSIEESACFL